MKLIKRFYGKLIHLMNSVWLPEHINFTSLEISKQTQIVTVYTWNTRKQEGNDSKVAKIIWLNIKSFLLIRCVVFQRYLNLILLMKISKIQNPRHSIENHKVGIGCAVIILIFSEVFRHIWNSFNTEALRFLTVIFYLIL